MKSKEELVWIELLKKPAKTEEERMDLEIAGKAFKNQLNTEIRALSNELLSKGLRFSNPWEMVNSKEAYPEAIEILIRHIHKPYHDKNKEGIIRALTVKEAKGKANEELIKEYNVTPKEKDNLRWTIGNAFTVIITPEDVDRIIPIVHDKTNGMSRFRFVDALGKIKTEKSKACLQTLLVDAQMAPYALKALNKFLQKKT